MDEMFYTKEATYKFSFEGKTTYDYHYIDNIIGLRYRNNTDNIEGKTPTPIRIKGTKDKHKLIDAVLIGVRVYSTNSNGEKKAELLYFLPDIKYYVKMSYYKYNDLGEMKEELLGPVFLLNDDEIFKGSDV